MLISVIDLKVITILKWDIINFKINIKNILNRKIIE